MCGELIRPQPKTQCFRVTDAVVCLCLENRPRWQAQSRATERKLEGRMDGDQQRSVQFREASVRWTHRPEAFKPLSEQTKQTEQQNLLLLCTLSDRRGTCQGEINTSSRLDSQWKDMKAPEEMRPGTHSVGPVLERTDRQRAGPDQHLPRETEGRIATLSLPEASSRKPVSNEVSAS